MTRDLLLFGLINKHLLHNHKRHGPVRLPPDWDLDTLVARATKLK